MQPPLTSSRSFAPGTLGHVLEQDRIRRRRQRLERVIAALRVLQHQAPRPGIAAAMADFRAELDRLGEGCGPLTRSGR